MAQIGFSVFVSLFSSELGSILYSLFCVHSLHSIDYKYFAYLYYIKFNLCIV